MKVTFELPDSTESIKLDYHYAVWDYNDQCPLDTEGTKVVWEPEDGQLVFCDRISDDEMKWAAQQEKKYKAEHGVKK